jgi:hypothetical protein
MERFSNTFFTVVKPSDFGGGGAGGGGGYTPIDLWQEVQSLAAPIAAEGNAGGDGVEELQAQTRLKLDHARQAVDTTFSLLSFDLSNAADWVGVRKAQGPGRDFGPGVDAAWAAFTKAVPHTGLAPGGGPQNPDGMRVYDFMQRTPASSFFAGPPMPAGEPVAPVKW